jgi:hypothetical protein
LHKPSDQEITNILFVLISHQQGIFMHTFLSRRALNIMSLIGFLILSSCGAGGASFTVYGSSTSPSASVNRALVTSQPAFLGTPTKLVMSVYALWLSPNTDCSDAVEVENYGDTPEDFDLIDSPTLFSGTPTPGTYQCLIMKISDNITFRSDATGVADNPSCVSTTTDHVFDIYRDDSGDDGTWIDIDGNTIAATGAVGDPGDDIVYIFGSTTPADLVAAGVSVNQLLPLNSALTLPGSATFVFDFTDQVSTNNNTGTDYCWVEGPEMSFE